MKNTINVVKILNLPIDNNQTKSVDCFFELEFDKNIYYVESGNFFPKADDAFINISEENITINKVYYSEAVWVMDDQGNKYTLFDFSYRYYIYVLDYRINMAFNGIMRGEHLGSIKQQMFDRIEFEIDYKRPIKLDFDYDDVHICAEPINYSKEEYSHEEMGEFGDFFQPEFKRKVNVTLTGRTTFDKFEKIIWRLSELVLLCYEDMFFYDSLTVFIGEKAYILKNFNRTDKRELRKNNLFTKSRKSSIYCNKALNGENFINFMEFRKESGIIYDVFRSTIYSNSFREDYPLRLSQTMEGLANYLEIANTEKKM